MICPQSVGTSQTFLLISQLIIFSSFVINHSALDFSHSFPYSYATVDVLILVTRNLRFYDPWGSLSRVQLLDNLYFRLFLDVLTLSLPVAYFLRPHGMGDLTIRQGKHTMCIFRWTLLRAALQTLRGPPPYIYLI